MSLSFLVMEGISRDQSQYCVAWYVICGSKELLGIGERINATTRRGNTDSMTRKREVCKCKWRCENSFSAEESYHGAMSGTKRHANRKAEELEKLCNARFALFLTIQRVIFQSRQGTRPRPEKASPSSKKCKKPNLCCLCVDLFH